MSRFHPGDIVRLVSMSAKVVRLAGRVGEREVVELEVDGRTEIWYTTHLELVTAALPTRPGSVVLCANTGLYFLRSHDCWVNELGDKVSARNFHAADCRHRVVFDAGANS